MIATDKPDFEEKVEESYGFWNNPINDTFKIDLIYLKGAITPEFTSKLDEKGFAWIVEEDLKPLAQVEETSVFENCR